jgi:hypothetical protein
MSEFAPEQTGIDVERLPAKDWKLGVPCLTVVVGVSFLPPLGQEPPKGVMATVMVDDNLVFDGLLWEASGDTPWRNTDEDVPVLTPREEGVEVTVEFGGRGGKKFNAEGYELWLHLVR